MQQPKQAFGDMDAHTDIAAMKPENNKRGRGMRPTPAFLDAPLSLCLGEKSSQIPQEASGSSLEASIRGFLNHVGAPLSCSSHPCLRLSHSPSAARSGLLQGGDLEPCSSRSLEPEGHPAHQLLEIKAR